MTALGNRRFRTVLLLWAGIPITALYVWQALVQPLLLGAYQGDFQESYMRAAGRIAAGLDPYDLCRTMGCLEPTGPQYVMPPLLAWLLQPAVGVDSHTVGVAVILVLNAALVVFLVCMLRALKIEDRQLAALLVLIAMTFGMTGNIEEGQVNPILLALSGMWLWGWAGARWWGGIALGAEIALKLIQAPVVLLVVVARRWSMLAAAAVTGVVLWLVAAPQFLFEYLFQVLPQVSGGTGLYENQSPGGTITRLFAPDTFFGGVYGSPAPARAITVAIALLVLAITLWVVRSPSDRALEAAAIVAATPLVTTYSWGTHLVLLLLPILVLVAWAVRRREWRLLAVLAAGYALINFGHHALQVLLVSGYSDVLVLRIIAESGVTGVLLIWLSTLGAIRRERSFGLVRETSQGSRPSIAIQPASQTSIGL